MWPLLNKMVQNLVQNQISRMEYEESIRRSILIFIIVIGE